MYELIKKTQTITRMGKTYSSDNINDLPENIKESLAKKKVLKKNVVKQKEEGNGKQESKQGK